MKKLSMILCVSMIVSLCACSSNNSETALEDTKLTYWSMLDAGVTTHVSTADELPMYKEWQEKTGIDVDFIHPSIGQASEQFNLMISSGKLPDIIEYWWPQYPGGPQKAIDDGLIMPLNDYIDSSAPNFKKIISGNDILSKYYDKGSKTDSGQYFAFPHFNTGDARIFGGLMVRQDWLDELGFEMPTTIDEWTNVLRAFKTQKGVKSPLIASEQYFIGTSSQNIFSGAFGVGKGLYAEDGRIKFGPMEKEKYKAYLKLLHDWYAEGLIDKDFSVADSSLIDSKMLNGESGATVGYIGGTLGKYLKNKKDDPNYNLVCAPYPSLNKGEQCQIGMSEGDVVTMYAAITPACKNPEAAVKFLDYLYGEEGYKLVNFGVEGVSYNMVDGKPVYTDLILNNPDGLSTAEAITLNCNASAKSPGLHQAPEYLEQYYEFPQQVDGFKMWSEFTDGFRKTSLPDGLFPTSEESSELGVLQADISTYVMECSLKFVSGENSLDKYDEFVESLQTKFNINKYLQIQQDMYDRYMKR